MAESSNKDASSQGQNKGGAVPAWKLRESMRSAPPRSRSGLDAQKALKKKMDKATLDPNLPSAFKVAIKGRVAFAKQQARRKNNDTFVSLNSSHPATKEGDTVPDYDSSDDDSFASMGADIIEEEE